MHFIKNQDEICTSWSSRENTNPHFQWNRIWSEFVLLLHCCFCRCGFNNNSNSHRYSEQRSVPLVILLLHLLKLATKSPKEDRSAANNNKNGDRNQASSSEHYYYYPSDSIPRVLTWGFNITSAMCILHIFPECKIKLDGFCLMFFGVVVAACSVYSFLLLLLLLLLPNYHQEYYHHQDTATKRIAEYYSLPACISSLGGTTNQPTSNITGMQYSWELKYSKRWSWMTLSLIF